ncbi:hypothetical protein Tco_1174209 [Tanacetum coccineum]
MKEIFEELEAEVDQNVVNRKYDETERKNLLIVNDNLIVDYLSKDVFYIATNFELTISRFTEMPIEAHTVVQSRCLELEAELSKLHDKVQKDDHTELVKRFSNLEVLINSTTNGLPMLDRTDFASWQQRIRLYCRGKENVVNILKSIDEGPFQMGTVRDPITEGTEGAHQLGLERALVYSDLSLEDKDRYNADIRATNILLQGLPKDIYTLINHYTEAKDIWDNVKMLLEGSELTKEDRESQLFVTAVKLNRGLRDSNYDQLYAYLKQHKAHANENKMMLDRFTQHTVDPLALMSNVSQQQYY